MKNWKRKVMAVSLAAAMSATLMVGCGEQGNTNAGNDNQNTGDGTAPKYVFLFIGDGMGLPQATSLSIYNGTVENDFTGTRAEPTPDNKPTMAPPSFLKFPVIGLATTMDASKFVTDSAAAATALACGEKTLDGMVGVRPDGSRLESVAEVLRDRDYKIGIVTSAFMNDATPAGFYGHVPSRKDRYDLCMQLLESDFDYFGGGGLKKNNGDGTQPDVFDLAPDHGYTVVNTREDFEALNGESGKVIAYDPNMDMDKGLQYVIDSKRKGVEDLTLTDYVSKGIEVLGDEAPFFMMVEGGKIDWAAHANDPLTLIEEVRELDNAISVATKFADEHPDETLIVVTGDHETGGFAMGFNGTEYDTFLKVLSNQKISYVDFQYDYIAGYRENKTPFEEAMKDVQELYGLVMPNAPEAATVDPRLVLNEAEIKFIKEGYEASMVAYEDRNPDSSEYRAKWSLYDYEPFQLRVTQTLSNKAGLGWTSTAHTGLPAPVYAYGVGQEHFENLIDNTTIANTLKEICTYGA